MFFHFLLLRSCLFSLYCNWITFMMYIAIVLLLFCLLYKSLHFCVVLLWRNHYIGLFLYFFFYTYFILSFYWVICLLNHFFNMFSIYFLFISASTCSLFFLYISSFTCALWVFSIFLLLHVPYEFSLYVPYKFSLYFCFYMIPMSFLYIFPLLHVPINFLYNSAFTCSLYIFCMFSIYVSRYLWFYVFSLHVFVLFIFSTHF